MARKSKGNFKKKKKKKKNNPMFFGYPWSLISAQPLVKMGHDFKCVRCGGYHVMQDGKREFPETSEGDVFVYQCCERWLVGAIKGHNVVGLDDHLAPMYQMAFLLSDMVHILFPLAMMATHAEAERKELGALETGKEVIPIKIPIDVARTTRYVVDKSNKLLNSLKFVETVEEPRIEIDADERPTLWTPDHERGGSIITPK